MGNFNRGRRPSGGRNFGRRDFGDRDGGRSFDRGERREMFKTVCSNCGNECEVPFRPTSGKPVYCSDCFEKMGGRRQDSPRPERSDFRAPAPNSDQNKSQFDALNTKLDRILVLLEPKTKEILTTTTSLEEDKVEKTPKAKKKPILTKKE